MNAREIREKEPSKSAYDGNGGWKSSDVDIARASFIAVRELAAQVAEANEYLKRIVCPPLCFESGSIDPETLKDAQPGKIAWTPGPKSLRDEIAIAALTAIISRGDLDTEMNVAPYCQDAYTIADAMLEARKK